MAAGAGGGAQYEEGKFVQLGLSNYARCVVTSSRLLIIIAHPLGGTDRPPRLGNDESLCEQLGGGAHLSHLPAERLVPTHRVPGHVQRAHAWCGPPLPPIPHIYAAVPLPLTATTLEAVCRKGGDTS
jgi:hypothetical protein